MSEQSPDGTERLLDPYHPNLLRRYVAVMLPAFARMAVSGAAIWAGVQYVGFEATVLLGLLITMTVALSQPNPYQFRTRVRRIVTDMEGRDE